MDLTLDEALQQPDLVWMASRKWLLRRPFLYKDGDNRILIPANFVCDLASVPRGFWWLISPDDLGEKAALLHDWLYRHGGVIPGCGPYTRKQADDLFRRAMLEDDVPGWKRKAAYAAVRLGGGCAWKD